MLPRNTVVLAKDVMLSRAVELGLDVHADEQNADDDWIVALPGGRMQPKVVCSATAALLSQFRTPTTIIAALAHHAKKTGQDANDIIDQTYPLFSELTVAGALIESGEAEHLRTLIPGQVRRLGSWLGRRLVGLLRWSTRSRDAVPLAAIESALDRLASLKVLEGRGARWTVNLDGGGHVGGWCHGAAGMVALWVTAHRILHDDRWLNLAIEAGFHIADVPAPDGTPCCGRAGRAFALLALYGATRERSWLYRAQYLARTSLELPLPKTEFEASLMKGKLGMALAVAEVASAREASSSDLGFPWFLA